MKYVNFNKLNIELNQCFTFRMHVVFQDILLLLFMNANKPLSVTSDIGCEQVLYILKGLRINYGIKQFVADCYGNISSFEIFHVS